MSLLFINVSKVFSHIFGSEQSASVVIIQLYFAIFIAVVMASFFGEFVNLLLEITLKSFRCEARNLIICSTESSSDSSSTKITSKQFLGYSILSSVFNNSDKLSASFLKGIIIENVVV